MAITTVIKSIGATGRDYATLALWEAAADIASANFTTSRSSTTQAGSTAATIVLDAGASGTNGFYTNHAVYCDARPDEKRLITAYVGATKVATIGALNGSNATWDNTPGTEAYTIDQTIWEGQCYNDAEFTANVVLDNVVTSATCYYHLTAAAGQSFQDHATVRTNPLRYDQTKGVGILTSSGTSIHFNGTFGKVSRLQVWQSVTGGGTALWAIRNPMEVRDCFAFNARGNNAVITEASVSGALFVNVVCERITDGVGIDVPGAIINVIGCAVIRPTDVTPNEAGINGATGSALKSTAIFGYSTAVGGGTWSAASSGNNATNLSSGLPGGSNRHSVPYNQFAPFVDADKDSLDLRTVPSALVGNGVLDAVNAPLDISLRARAGAATIGHWELGRARFGGAGQRPRPFAPGLAR